MVLPFPLFLALKYLKPKRTYFSVISLLSLLGVLLGVAVLVIVLSVMSGFDDLWREKILGFNAHVVVTAPEGLDDETETLGRIRAVPGVAGAAACVEGLVVIQHRGQILTPVLRGVDEAGEREVSRIPDHMVAGRFALEGEQAVVGRDLARRLGISVGDKLLVNAPRHFMARDELALPEELTVAGIFELGMWEYDVGFVLCGLEKGRELFGLESGATTVRVMTVDPYRAAAVAADLRAVLGPEVRVETWMEQNRQLFSALRVEKNMMFFLLIFITIVAAFGITNTLITVTVQKTREIGLLKAIGFSSGSVMGIFLWLGGIQGVAGTLAGLGTGWLALRYRNDLMHWLSDTFRLELFPKELYRLSEIPARTSVADVLVVSLSVIVICTLAGLLPAWRAARLDPVAALRHE